MSKKIKFGVGIGVVVLAVLILVIQGYTTREAVAYSKRVSELKRMGDKAVGIPLKVSGRLKKGSIQRDGVELRFVLVEGVEELPVHYVGRDPIPDTFRDDMDADVVITGQLTPERVFQAERIQAKCASKYEADYSAISSAGL